ncbi:MAG: nucleotidyltransferase [Pseudomonadota bacterium]|nr:nucleotidyltransferase [Pseudomonadota bacterium]
MTGTFVLAAFEAISRELTEAKVRFLVVDGLAVYAFGGERITHDIDLVIQLDATNVGQAFKALERAGYRPLVPVTSAQFGDPTARERLIAEKGMVVLNFWSDQFPQTHLDIFVTEPFDFDTEYGMAHAEEILPGVEFRYPRVETLLDMKRRAGRPKDLHDIAYLESLDR